MHKRPSDQGPARDDGLLEQTARPPWKKTKKVPNVLAQLQATFKHLSFHAKQFGPEKNINVQDVWRLMMSAPEVQAFNIETQSVQHAVGGGAEGSWRQVQGASSS
jgi:hypothetical protein